MNKIKMLHYDKIEFSEFMLKRQVSQKRLILLFSDKGFRFQSYVCNEYYDSLIMFMNLSWIAVLNIKGADHFCVIRKISKGESINLTKNVDLSKEVWNMLEIDGEIMSFSAL